MDIPDIREVSLTEALNRRRGATIDQAFLEQLTQTLKKLAGDRALIMTVPHNVKYTTFKRWVDFAAERAGVTLIIRRDPDGLRCWLASATAQKTRPKKGIPRVKDTDMAGEMNEEQARHEPDESRQHHIRS